MTSEYAVGEKAGLDRHRVLASDCADFYVLESLENELFPWFGDARYSKGDFPIGFDRDLGLDKRHELRAYSVQRTLKTREEALAREFSLYLSLACGGELRHITRFLNGTAIVHKHQCVHKHGTECCEHLCADWAHGADSGLPSLTCGCFCKHSHGVDFPCAEGWVGCTYGTGMCCGHNCDSTEWKEKCYEVTPPYKPTDRVQKYLASLSGNPTKVSRGLGWQTWWNLSKRTMAAWMQECADAFNHPMWYKGGDSGGFGGYKWGTAAQLCADYLAGVITPRTFIDRCWSLQHNGGCIFNKFYPLPATTDGHRDALMYVLEQQAANNYDYLVAEHCTPYVRELWREHERKMGKVTLVQEIQRIIDSPIPGSKAILDKATKNWPWGESGCFSCWWASKVGKFQGIPCVKKYHKTQGTPLTVSKDCAYTKMLKLWWPWDPSTGEGCLACAWQKSQHVDAWPCSGSGMAGPNKNCDYYASFLSYFGITIGGKKKTAKFKSSINKYNEWVAEHEGCYCCAAADFAGESSGPDPCGVYTESPDEDCGWYTWWCDNA